MHKPYNSLAMAYPRKINTRNKFIDALPVVLLTLCIHACSLFQDPTETEEKSVDLYRRAKASLLLGNYAAAIETYEKLEVKFPFNPYAPNIALESAYAYYKNRNAPLALEKLDFFIEQYPNHPNTDYAYYLKGRAYYNYAKNFIHLVINYDRTDKDPEPLKNAFATFTTLIKEHPDSRYTPDARRHLIVIRNLLAIYEIKVANYYFNRKAHIATVNRIKYMLEYYAGAKHTPDGLLLMIEAYRRLGNNKLADDTARVLALNFPDYADRRLNKEGKVILQIEEDWSDTLDDISDTILETLRLKPRY